MGSKTAKVKGLLSKGFKSDKCKTSIKLSMARMKLMRNKRDVEVKRIRRDVAQLLQSGDESTARIRVDHVIRDEKTISAYELLEVYCELIIQRLHIIDSQKICPIDLKEAIATVVFAAPRCADVPELSEVSKQFQAKYGKEFINASLELRPGSGVSPLIIDKLSASSANIEIKVKVLKSIAEENNVKWEAKGFEEETKAPQLARLDGSSKFLKVSETAAVQPGPTQTPPPVTTYQPQNYTHHANVATVQPGPTQTPPPVTTYQPQNYKHPENVAPVEPGPTQTPPPVTTNQPQNYTHHQPTRPNNSSGGTPDPPLATPVQVVRTQSTSRYSDNQYASGEEAEKSTKDLPDHNAYYASIEEAADAAAKSAELASKAAKAAAAMARHGSLSREQSNVSSKSYSSRDSPRKHDMEEVSSNTNTSWDAKGPQVGPPFKRTPDRSSVAPPSPQSSISSSSYGESCEVSPRPVSRKSPEYSNEGPFSKQKSVVQKVEEYDFSGTNTRYNNTNSQESKAFQGPTYDDNGYDEEPDIFSSTSNTRFDSLDDSRFDTYDRPVYEEEPFYQFESKDSFANKGGAAWYSSDNFSSPKLPRSGSTSKNNSSVLFTSNTSEWDPPRSPVDKGSGTKFDKGLKSPSSSSLFDDENSTLLSVLSGRARPQSQADEDSGPKFDSGPNFDSDVLSADVEEEKVVEEETFAGTSLSPLSHAKERTNKSALSMRTKRNEMVQPRITKDSRAKAENAPLRYTPKENSSDDDDDASGKQQSLDFENMIIGGRRNRSRYSQPPYNLKPLEEEPKPSNRHGVMKSMADSSVEEERIYSRHNSNSTQSEDRRKEAPQQSALRFIPNRRNSDKEEEETEEESIYSRHNSNSRESDDRRKEAPRRSALRFTPNRRNSDEEEEESEEEIAQQAKTKVKVPSSLRVPDYGNSEEEEEVVKPAKIKLKEPLSSSRVSKGSLGLRENKSDYQEPVRVGSSVRDSRPTRTTKEEPYQEPVEFNRRVVGNSIRDSRPTRTTKEEENKLEPVEFNRRVVGNSVRGSRPTRTTKEEPYQEPVEFNRRVVGNSVRDSRPTRTTEEEENKPEPVEFNRRVIGNSVRDSRPTRTTKEEALEVRKDEPPMEKTKKEKEAPIKSSPVDKSKEKKEEEKEEKASVSPPTFPPLTFPLDMDALKARVQLIQATMNNP